MKMKAKRGCGFNAFIAESAHKRYVASHIYLRLYLRPLRASRQIFHLDRPFTRGLSKFQNWITNQETVFAATTGMEPLARWFNLNKREL